MINSVDVDGNGVCVYIYVRVCVRVCVYVNAFACMCF
jgi:hypothetical protein